MKRKDEAEERNQVEKETQKSVERTHWTLEEKLPSTIESSNKLKFIVEYDNTGGISGTVRQSFKNFNKKEAEDSTSTNVTNSTNGTTKATKATKVNSATAEPMNKIPKLSENKNKN